jgi:ketosteroid isomerase-like protein
MSDNLAVARRWVELYNERDGVAEFLSLLDPEVELQTLGGPRLRGHDQAGDWFEKDFENVRSRIIPDRFVEEGDVVAGLGRIEVRWIESGEIAREFESAAVFWFRDAKIVRWQPFETHDTALRAAGLASERGWTARGARCHGRRMPALTPPLQI